MTITHKLIYVYNIHETHTYMCVCTYTHIHTRELTKLTHKKQGNTLRL